MADSARIRLTWGKVLGKDLRSRYCCSTNSSRWCCVRPRNACSLMQSSQTTRCSSNESSRKARRELHELAKLTVGGGVERRRRRRKKSEVQRMRGMLYANDAPIVSRSTERVETMMVVVVTGCSAIRLTVSEEKTEIMCMQTKCGGNFGEVHNKRRRRGIQKSIRFCVLGRGYHAADGDLSHQNTHRLHRA